MFITSEAFVCIHMENLGLVLNELAEIDWGYSFTKKYFKQRDGNMIPTSYFIAKYYNFLQDNGRHPQEEL